MYFGWGTWIRTRTNGVRVRGSTVNLFPKALPGRRRTIARGYVSAVNRRPFITLAVSIKPLGALPDRTSSVRRAKSPPPRCREPFASGRRLILTVRVPALAAGARVMNGWRNMPQEAPQKEVPQKQAKQGENSRRVLVVLAASLIAAMVVWGAAELYFDVALEPEVEAS